MKKENEQDEERKREEMRIVARKIGKEKKCEQWQEKNIKKA